MNCASTGEAATTAVGADVLRLEAPFPEYALPRVWTWIEDFRHRVADDFSLKSLGEFMRHWEERRPFRKSWGVWRGKELGGLVIYEPWQPGVGTSHALFKRSFWGRNVTRAALEQVYGELFDSGVRKVVSFPFRGNNAIIALGKSLGAVSEGLLKAQTLREGQPIDVVILSLFKEDFDKCRSSRPPCPTSRPESAPLPAA